MKKYGLIQLPESLVSNDPEYLALCIEDSAIDKMASLQEQLTDLEAIGVDTLKIPNLFSVVHLKKPTGKDYEDVSHNRAIADDAIEIYKDKMNLTYCCRHTEERFHVPLPAPQALLIGEVSPNGNCSPQGLVKFFK